jgi:uncharacterized protein YerC
MQGLQKQISKTFFQTLEDLKSKENLALFFADFLTEKEHGSLTKRLAIAYWLHKKRDYENIKTNLNVSLKEIEEVENKLDSDGYKLALKYMEAEEWSNKWAENFKKLASS